MVEKYGSDVSREQFEIIQEDLEKAKKATRPRKVDLYDIFCALGLHSSQGSEHFNIITTPFYHCMVKIHRYILCINLKICVYISVWKNINDFSGDAGDNRLLSKLMV